jgi:spore coat polysaccharide biosynthesis protein SpsF
MRTVAVVQARVRSARLPAKVLLDLGGATALERCLQRVKRIPRVDDVVVATSDRVEDPADHCHGRRLGYRWSVGREDDVLDRFVKAAGEGRAEAVVRMTSGCPLMDPMISGDIVSSSVKSPADYVSNTLERRLPRGLDTEIASYSRWCAPTARPPGQAGST